MITVLGREAFFRPATSRTSTHAHHVSKHHAATPIMPCVCEALRTYLVTHECSDSKKKCSLLLIKYLRLRSKI